MTRERTSLAGRLLGLLVRNTSELRSSAVMKLWLPLFGNGEPETVVNVLFVGSNLRRP
jgi:hypothetical protein